jgi:hypothetical protein
VIWGILGTERLIGRTFDLATSYVWIAPAAMLVGAGLGAGLAGIAAARIARSRRRGDHSPL